MCKKIKWLFFTRCTQSHIVNVYIAVYSFHIPPLFSFCNSNNMFRAKKFCSHQMQNLFLTLQTAKLQFISIHSYDLSTWIKACYYNSWLCYIIRVTYAIVSNILLRLFCIEDVENWFMDSSVIFWIVFQSYLGWCLLYFSCQYK